MRICVIAVGRLKKGPETDLCSRYTDRIKPALRSLGISGFDLVELAESRAGSSSRRKKEEAEAIRAKLRAGTATVFLDERGKSLESRAFAGLLEDARDSAQDITFVIGGADGLDRELSESPSAQSVSFGRATWPHQLVRIMLLEQIYRGLTILGNHPYHRD